MIINSRYELLEQVGEGGMGVVYQAYDRLTAQTIALKQVTTPGSQLNFTHSTGSVDFRLALTMEFKTLASMRHPNIISVLDYGFNEHGQPFFTMELLENAKNIIEIGRNQTETEKVNLLIQILQALAYLHRRGILHRDLKPANIMVDVHSEQVKVLDFGLAIAREHLVEVDSELTVGTLAYLAPEVLQGIPASESSDLYAVGIIAYQLFTGSYPFDQSRITGLISQIIKEIPDVENLDINPQMRNSIQRLLSKIPTERYGSAEEVINIYQTVIGQSITPQTHAIRESFLQSATFVGRDNELKQLTTALDKIMTFDSDISPTELDTQSGSIWLVGGESGVGKSRLLDELRVRAMVKGATVVKGQATVDAGVPYQTWRNVLRSLVLYSDLSDLEAGVLQRFVPDIAKLLNREINAPPELDPQASQARLFQVIESIFERIEQPLVVLLEDLHWSNESINLLKYLNPIIHQLPILIIGSYRDDERPDLPDELLAVNVIRLSRLSSDAIADLSASMLGENIGRQEKIVTLLERETEGNVFFIVEVVRTLAEQAGNLSQIGNLTLPAQVFAQGINSVIQNRLARVPADALPLVQNAAIIGRHLDLRILKALAEQDDLSEWLTTCSTVAVLEIVDNTWQFAHDKIREGVLADLTTEQIRQCKKDIALAIEQVYPDNPDWYARLADFWHAVKDTDKETYYTRLAGEQALMNSAYQSAIEYLERLLDLSEATQLSKLECAKLERQLARAYLGTERLNDGIQHLHQALALLGKPVPQNQHGLLLHAVRGLLRHGFRRLMRMSLARQVPVNYENLLEQVRIYEELGLIHYLRNESLPVIHSISQSINIAQAIGKPTPELMRTYANTAIIVGLIPLHQQAEHYLTQAQTMQDEVGDLPAQAWVATVTGVYCTGLGAWERAETAFAEAIRITTQIGDFHLLGDASAALTNVTRWQGNYARSLAISQEMIDAAQRNDNTQHLMWGIDGLALVKIFQGQFTQALALFKKAEVYLKADDVGSELSHKGGKAIAYLRLGQFDKALSIAETMLQAMKSTAPTLVSLLISYSDVAEVFLTLWANQPASHEFQQNARQACREMRRYARVFPVGQPRAYLCQGAYDWLNNKPQHAYKNWQKGLKYAQQLAMPLDEALIHFELGQHLPIESPAKHHHLRDALACFENLGAEWYIEQTKQLLE